MGPGQGKVFDGSGLIPLWIADTDFREGAPGGNGGGGRQAEHRVYGYSFADGITFPTWRAGSTRSMAWELKILGISTGW